MSDLRGSEGIPGDIVGALVMVGSVLDEEYQAFEDPNDPLIPIYYAISMVLFTFAILYIIKKKRDAIVRGSSSAPWRSP